MSWPPDRVPRLMAISAGDLSPAAVQSPRVGRWLHQLEHLDVALQLREKSLDDVELYELAVAVRARFAGTLLMNGRPDLARAAGAQGVHLTSQALPTDEVRAAFPDLLVGVSTHSVQRAWTETTRGAHYVFLSPIFATPSKPDHPAPLGLDALRAATREGARVLALGGIARANVSEVLRAGAHGVAGIRAFAEAPAAVAQAAGLR